MYPSWFNCNEKACHCVGRYYTFGTYEFMHENFSDEHAEFGRKLRNNYAQFMRTGEMDDFEKITTRSGENTLKQFKSIQNIHLYVDKLSTFSFKKDVFRL